VRPTIYGDAAKQALFVLWAAPIESAEGG